MVTDCKKCCTEKLNHTWSKLNFVAMAKKTEHLDQLIVQAYYLPMRHGHATFGAILSRLEGVRLEECHSFRPHRDARLTKL